MQSMTTQGNPLSARRDARPRGELPRLVSIEQIAAHLGVSVRHVRRLVFERRIPCVKWGHLLRFEIDEVVAWFTTSRVAAADDSAIAVRL